MANISFFTVTEINGETIDWVKIVIGENSYTWMTKENYDLQFRSQNPEDQ